MLKRIVLLMLASSMGWAEEPPAEIAAVEAPASESLQAVGSAEPAVPSEPVAATRNPVVLVKAGPVDEAILQRVKAWAESSLAIPAPIAESLETSATSMDAVAEEAAARLRPEDLGAVVLLDSESELPNHGIYREDLRVVVINVRLMRQDADEETFGRRMERQVIRGIGSLMGLEPSPNPESAMAYYSTLEELDQIGRNLDPPWLYRLQQRARECGIPLDAENPVNLLQE